ncbi:hypothetical protein [Leucobacter aridicollis]|uniref:Uncharacterized protein n=1 Tax=Leucobacter aridicollis TaxID=283878 RepID=A0A852R928_9MICO|nr:hypothetical protein [Leucobacter aridicollis]MBL3682033.1 hypothetical protein [Leucobacter aridicollis]NYD26919.1 hypothetical protein [Leucobacter aridicollis]
MSGFVDNDLALVQAAHQATTDLRDELGRRGAEAVLCAAAASDAGNPSLAAGYSALVDALAMAEREVAVLAREHQATVQRLGGSQ